MLIHSGAYAMRAVAKKPNKHLNPLAERIKVNQNPTSMAHIPGAQLPRN